MHLVAALTVATLIVAFPHPLRPKLGFDGSTFDMLRQLSPDREWGYHEQAKHVAWGYDLHNGPATWASTYPLCAGKSQSPIDIDTKTVVEGVGDLDQRRTCLSISFNQAAAGTLARDNNGHTVKFSGDGLNGDTSALHSSVLSSRTPYSLLQFHFHAGSETRIDGEQFPLEAHFVHQDAGGHYFVVAVLFRLAPKGSAAGAAPLGLARHAQVECACLHAGAAEFVLRSLDFGAAVGHGPTVLSSALNPIELLPTAWQDFYYYHGPFTPPHFCYDDMIVRTHMVPNPSELLPATSQDLYYYQGSFTPPHFCYHDMVVLTHNLHVRTSLPLPRLVHAAAYYTFVVSAC